MDYSEIAILLFFNKNTPPLASLRNGNNHSSRNPKTAQIVLPNPRPKRLDAVRPLTMALDGPSDRRDEVLVAMGNGNGVAPSQPSRPAGRPAAAAPYADRRLRLNPNAEHKPQDYSDVRGEYAPAVYSALERHLPPSLLDADRDVKLHFMRDILARYWPQGERNKVWISIPRSHLLMYNIARICADVFLCYFYWS